MLLEEWAGPRKGRILCGLVGNFYSLRTKRIPMERSGIRSLVRILYGDLTWRWEPAGQEQDAHDNICHEKLVKVLLIQLYPTFCDPMACSPPGSSVLGMLQARILER